MKSGGDSIPKKGKNTNRTAHTKRRKAHTKVSSTSKTGTSGKKLTGVSQPEKTSKKIGGVRITLERVADRTPINQRRDLRTPGVCPCGKMRADCDDDWDKRLGITSRSMESVYGSAGVPKKSSNLAKVRRAEISGLDPYCNAARWAVDHPDYRSHWTPYMPEGSFVPTPENIAKYTSTTTGGNIGTNASGRNRRKR
jgi:hypothetical protein